MFKKILLLSICLAATSLSAYEMGRFQLNVQKGYPYTPRMIDTVTGNLWRWDEYDQRWVKYPSLPEVELLESQTSD